MQNGAGEGAGGPPEREKSREALIAEAQRCRRLALGVGDDRTVAALDAFAASLEQRAAEAATVEATNIMPQAASSTARG